MRKGNVNNKSKEFDELDSNAETTIESLDTKDIVKENETVQPNSEVQKGKNKDKLKIIILIVVIVLAVCITAGLLIYKYLNTNKQQVPESSGTNSTEIGVKKETEDKKYLVSFTDMYETNPINITDKLYEQKATKKQGSLQISYVEISGL